MNIPRTCLKIALNIVAVMTIFAMVALSRAGDNKVITDADEAAAKAIIYTGFDRLDNYPREISLKARLVSVASDSTPYVSQIINSKQVWRVSLPDVPLAAIRPVDRSTTATFEVYIDPENGRLLKIAARFADTAYSDPGPNLPPPKEVSTSRGPITVYPAGPPPGEREWIFNEIGNAGFPDSPPTAFLDVMRNCPLNMARAVALEAVYVNQRWPDTSDVRPVWITWLHGYPLSLRDPYADMLPEEYSAPAGARRWVINEMITSDGHTGEFLRESIPEWATRAWDQPDNWYRLAPVKADTNYSPGVYIEDRSRLRIQIDVNQELVITDPAGRRTGTDPISDRQYEEIPRASYYYHAIGSRTGPARIECRLFEKSRPINGDYKVTAIGTANDGLRRRLHITCYDLSSERWQGDFDHDVPETNAVFKYILSLDRIVATKCRVRGEFAGGGDEAVEVDWFLTYANISDSVTTLPLGTDSLRLAVIYSPKVTPETLTATMNGEDVAALFAPAESLHELVRVPLRSGENRLVMTIQGDTADGPARDTDSLVFVVE